MDKWAKAHPELAYDGWLLLHMVPALFRASRWVNEMLGGLALLAVLAGLAVAVVLQGAWLWVGGLLVLLALAGLAHANYEQIAMRDAELVRLRGEITDHWWEWLQNAREAFFNDNMRAFMRQIRELQDEINSPESTQSVMAAKIDALLATVYRLLDKTLSDNEMTELQRPMTDALMAGNWQTTTHAYLETLQQRLDTASQHASWRWKAEKEERAKKKAQRG